eukprot:CFRG8432T1
MGDQGTSQPERVSKPQELVRAAKEKIDADKQAKKDAESQNIAQGTGKGLLSIGGGALTGVGAIILGPVVGATVGAKAGASKSENMVGKAAAGVGGGVVGVVGGLLGGATVGLIAIGGGIAGGVSHLGHGVKNTFKSEKKEDRSSISGTDSDIAKALKMDEAAYVAERDAYLDNINKDFGVEEVEESLKDLPRNKPVDNELYEILGVDYDATPNQIKKAYYKKAQITHPDKHPGDDTAAATFQKVGEAYQILGDPEKRSTYNQKGKEAAIQGLQVMDPALLFSVMFGNKAFVHLIGDIAHSMETSEDTAKSKEMMAVIQTRRESRLAKVLEARIAEYVATLLKADEDGSDHKKAEEEATAKLSASAKREVHVLSCEMFGKDLLNVIGYIYEKKGKMILGKHHTPIGLQGFFRGMQESGHMFKVKQRVWESAVNASIQEQKARAVGEETVDEAEERAAISMLGMLWLASIIDIETTLRTVVTLVCTDEKISKKERKYRAQAIVVIGEEFNAA